MTCRARLLEQAEINQENRYSPMKTTTITCNNINPLMGTSKPQSWELMGGLLHLIQRGGAGPTQSPPRCTKCNSLPINDQCTNFLLFNMALQLPLHS